MQTSLLELLKNMHNVKNHEMNLNPLAFSGVKSGKQKIEVRLNDQKREEIKVNDHITFYLLPDKREKIVVKVIQLLKYPTFKELFSNISLEDWNARDWSIDMAIEQMHKYYSLEDENKYGVVGIKILYYE